MEGQQIWNRFRKYFCFSCWIKWNTNRNTRRDQRYELREAYSCFIELYEIRNKAFSRPSRVYTTHVEVITFSFTAKDTRRQCQRHLSSGMYELFRCSHSALFLCLSCLCFSVVKHVGNICRDISCIKCEKPPSSDIYEPFIRHCSFIIYMFM